MNGEVVRAALRHLWDVLEPLGHPMALMGGISLAAWSRIRVTQDVDFLISIDLASVDRLIEILAAHHCKPKRIPALVTVGDHRFLQFLYTPPDEFYDVQFDVLLAETEFQQSAVARRVRRRVPGLDDLIDVVNCDDLIVFKLLAGRVIDRADAAMLLRENRDDLDFSYLDSWIIRLSLADEYAEIWREAFPEDPHRPVSPATN
jgi:hypothetical protein